MVCRKSEHRQDVRATHRNLERKQVIPKEWIPQNVRGGTSGRVELTGKPVGRIGSKAIAICRTTPCAGEEILGAFQVKLVQFFPVATTPNLCDTHRNVERKRSIPLGMDPNPPHRIV